MEEFVVWDNQKHIFLSEFQKSKLRVDTIVKNEMLKGLARYVFLEKLGLDDINNKPIIANCSIVTLNYFQSSDWIKDIGFFKWDNEMLRYEFHLSGEKEIVPFDPSYFDCMEIVDTIQKNKLGLIK
jgi:hypothetical protein